MELGLRSWTPGKYLCAATLLAAFALTFTSLGSRPFWDYDEAMYANIIHDTVLSGNIAAPVFYGAPFFQKPPLYFWVAIGADKVFGTPEFSYRVPAALAAVACVLLTMLITYEITGSALIAGLAGLVLLTTAPFMEAGRQVRLDVPATAGVLFSVWCFFKARKDPRWLLGIAVGAAFGIFFKSVIGLLSVPLIGMWSLFELDFTWLGRWQLWAGGLLGAGLMAPWLVYISFLYGHAFWDEFIFNRIVNSVVDNLISSSVTSLDYFGFLFTYALPWSPLVLLLLAWLITRYARHTRLERDALIFTLSALTITTIFFVSTTKLFYYLTPIYPFAAIAIALGGFSLYTRYERSARSVLLAATVALFLGAGINTLFFSFHWYRPLAINDIISSDEQRAGNRVAALDPSLPLYVYQYEYLDTLRYYSGRPVQFMKDDAVLDSPFFLAVSTDFVTNHSFDPELAAHLEVLFKGVDLTLYKFEP